MKIKTSNVHVHGKTVTLPEVGETLVGEDGVIEVSDELAELLINNTQNWTSAEEEKKVDSKKELIKHLSSMSEEDLKEIAQSANLDEDELKKASKKKGSLVNFLVNNLSDEFIQSILA